MAETRLVRPEQSKTSQESFRGVRRSIAEIESFPEFEVPDVLEPSDVLHRCFVYVNAYRAITEHTTESEWLVTDRFPVGAEYVLLLGPGETETPWEFHCFLGSRIIGSPSADLSGRLRDAVRDVAEGRVPGRPSKELMALAEEAVDALEAREDEDIDEWAERLGKSFIDSSDRGQ